MSAFVQSTAHIDLLVTGLVQYEVSAGIQAPDGWRRIDLSDRTEVGRILLRENVKSVMDRYGEDTIDPEEQSHYAAQIASYTFQPAALTEANLGAHPAVALLKAISGYGYQACEHDGWETSEAKAIVDALQSHCISHLPGYSAAFTWSFDPESDFGRWERLGYPEGSFPEWLKQQEKS